MAASGLEAVNTRALRVISSAMLPPSTQGRPTTAAGGPDAGGNSGEGDLPCEDGYCLKNYCVGGHDVCSGAYCLNEHCVLDYKYDAWCKGGYCNLSFMDTDGTDICEYLHCFSDHCRHLHTYDEGKECKIIFCKPTFCQQLFKEDCNGETDYCKMGFCNPQYIKGTCKSMQVYCGSDGYGMETRDGLAGAARGSHCFWPSFGPERA
jgi:hypothetical protein